MTVAVPGLLLLLVVVTLIWLVSLKLRDASIIDIFWGPGFAILAWFYAVLSTRGIEGISLSSSGESVAHLLSGRRFLVPLLVTLWATRLALHIYFRNRGHGEDPRYQAMRERHGEAFSFKSLFIVFWLQAVLLWVIAMPLFAVAFNRSSTDLTPLDFVALVVFTIGFLFEAVGDWQLKKFKADPHQKGKVLDTGLWRYTRHPNYFGDATLWWGYYLFAVAAGGAWTLLSPLLMTFLIIKVSGVALLEKSLGNTKPKYAEYIRKTPAFFPWFPKG